MALYLPCMVAEQDKDSRLAFCLNPPKKALPSRATSTVRKFSCVHSGVRPPVLQEISDIRNCLPSTLRVPFPCRNQSRLESLPERQNRTGRRIALQVKHLIENEHAIRRTSSLPDTVARLNPERRLSPSMKRVLAAQTAARIASRGRVAELLRISILISSLLTALSVGYAVTMPAEPPQKNPVLTVPYKMPADGEVTL